MSKLNTLRFTVHTENLGFKNKVLDFINNQEMINISSEANDYTYKLNLVDDFLTMYGQGGAGKFVDILKNEGISFFHLHIDGTHFSFSFDNITELYEFYKDNEIIGDIKSAYLAVDYMFSEYDLIQKRAKIIKNLMGFLREEGLFASSTIDAISFIHMISSTDDVNILKQQIKGDVLITTEDQRKNIYTGSMDYYKAYIKQPQKIIDTSRTAKGEDKIDIHALCEDKVFKILKEAIKKEFSQTKNLHVKKDAGGYYIHADEGCRKVWNKPVKIFDNISVEFKPVLIDMQNFYGICKPMKQECLLKLYSSKRATDKEIYNGLEKTEQAGIDNPYDDSAIYYKKIHEISVRTKEKNALILEINDWQVTDTNVLQSRKGHVYTLGDDVDELLKHIDKIPTFPNITTLISSYEIKEPFKKILS